MYTVNMSRDPSTSNSLEGKSFLHLAGSHLPGVSWADCVQKKNQATPKAGVKIK